MKEVIREIVECQDKIWQLKHKLENSEYWINKAKEEAGFEPQEGDWVSVEVTTWKIEVTLYHKGTIEGMRCWKNGKWFDTCFPEKFPYNIDVEKL